MELHFSNVNVPNWNELTDDEQKIVGEFFDKWFNKTDGLGFAYITDEDNINIREFYTKFVELYFLVPDALVELDAICIKEDGTKASFIIGVFEDVEQTRYLNKIKEEAGVIQP